MSRSLKKGPYIQEKLLHLIESMNERGDKTTETAVRKGRKKQQAQETDRVPKPSPRNEPDMQGREPHAGGHAPDRGGHFTPNFHF